MTKKQYNRIVRSIQKLKKECPEGNVIGMNSKDLEDMITYVRKVSNGIEFNQICGLDIVHSDQQERGVFTILYREPKFSKN